MFSSTDQQRNGVTMWKSVYCVCPNDISMFK